MIQCNAGHFYDETKHSGCPYCGVPLNLDLPSPTLPVGHMGSDSQKTIPLRQDAGDGGKTVPIHGGAAPAGGPAGATRRLIREQLGIDPVVGWLVCLDGPDRGRDYRIRAEKNFIGRDPSMDICLAGDDSISRQKHATVAFEPKKGTFWLIPGEASGLVYLNGEVLYAPAQLKERDIVELGKTKLVLVPFVNDGFHWE
jgi:hypothetical protein